MASAGPDRTTPWSLSEMVHRVDHLASSAAWSPEDMGVWRWWGERGWGSTHLGERRDARLQRQVSAGSLTRHRVAR